ncbi:MAG: UDP-3-O-[3-hydroxymyristoyl] N-acetylglucosamine deacetylase [Lentisphaeria bacterium]|nr:UDP-3-O-acyl-N-acetylglucosamine deacetylase [Lentisphaeria bacterium]NQZ68794.1 UDP-3-O-[3-hydroxymyristoyl] N-acetylglucosamine deacetylase [Lentisphaeria bacterium]
MAKQQTLKTEVHYSGITLHTGLRAHIRLKPAPVNTGFVIVRIDVDGKPTGKALATNVIDTHRATTIACGNSPVHTVEHVLAALYASEVDNVIIEMDGPEPPIVDGSSRPFLEMINKAGISKQRTDREICVIKEAIWVEEGESKLIIIPDDLYRISCTVKYGVSILDTQYRSLEINTQSFFDELSLARTFCIYDEIEGLMKAGLIRGGSLDNAVVLKGDAIICKDEMRYPDEFVRHKMLDIVGDLSLVGRRLQGQIIAIKPGHPINVSLALKIIEKMGY